MALEARSLNLATAVAVILFEGVRQLHHHCD
jgi:tRNA(Leu) C34 or U34 (ribose-2'-O)-methylase TrmL